MRPSFRPTTVALVLVAALSLAGCTPEAQAPPTPAPSATPLFASDEEALAAAEEAYAAYLAVTDQIYGDGGVRAERLSEVATREQLESDIAGMKDIEQLGYRSVGRTTFDNIRLQRYVPNQVDGKAVVVVYLCQDVGSVDVFDASGQSVVLETRPDRTEFEVTFDGAEPDQARALLISHRQPWSDQSC